MKVVISSAFGPLEPSLARLLDSEELASRRLAVKVGPAILALLERHFGDKLSPTQRTEVGRKLIAPETLRRSAGLPDPASATNPSQRPPEEGPTDDSLTSIGVIVRMPGEVISSNGIRDPLSGDVFWTLLAPGLEYGPVELIARSRTR